MLSSFIFLDKSQSKKKNLKNLINMRPMCEKNINKSRYNTFILLYTSN